MAKISDFFTIEDRTRASGTHHYCPGMIQSHSMTKGEFDGVRRTLRAAGLEVNSAFFESVPALSTPKSVSAWFIGVSETDLAPLMDSEVKLSKVADRALA